jgi:predicted Zn finger-like uncharacterized protein
MKVECATCQARYQIPDERVAGRKLKIRCRKCSGAIIVRGDQLVAPVEETTQQAPAGYASTEWHVSIDGSQHGPYALDQMSSMLRNGQLAWDAHVWRDGYAEWRIAGDSDTLVRAVAARAGAAEDDGPTRMTQSAPPDELQPVARSSFAQRAANRIASQPPIADSGHYASQPPVGADPRYAYDTQPPSAADSRYPYDTQPAGALEPAYGDDPGYGHENPSDYGYAAGSRDYGAGAGYGGYGHPRVSAAQSMTGERNEDSVLFSSKSVQAAASSQAIPPPRSGFAGGEGSGLIDIRALAAMARTTQAPTAAPHSNGHSNGSSNGHHAYAQDEVLALANQTGAFGRLDSLAPFERAAPQSNNAVPLAIVAGSAMVAAAAFFGVYLTRAPAAPVPAPATEPVPIAAAAQPAVTPPEQLADAPAEAEPKAAAPAEPQAAAEDEPAADGDEPSAKDEAADQEVKTALRSIRKTRGNKRERMAYAASIARGDKTKADKPSKEKSAGEASAKKSESIDDLLLADSKPEPKKAEPEPAKKPEIEPAAAVEAVTAPAPAPAKPAGSARRSIDELLDGAVDKGDKKAAAPAAAAAGEGGSGLEPLPTREQVKAAMQGVVGEVKACAAGQSLESPSAMVAISVSGATGKVSSVRVTGIQGAVGSCIAKAVRGANFPKFSKDTFSINYPFRLK